MNIMPTINTDIFWPPDGSNDNRLRMIPIWDGWTFKGFVPEKETNI